MLAIDLLKGQGIPLKTRPAGASLTAIIIAVPMVATIITLGNYVRGEVILRNQKRLLTTIQTEIFKLTDSVKFKQDTERQIEDMNACFVEVDEAILRQIQWSPVLQVIAENMPSSLVLSSLNIKSELKSKDVPRRNDPLKKVSVPFPKRTLYISLYGKQIRGSDEAVLEFLSALNASNVGSDRADKPRLVAQATDEKKNVTNYVIEYVFMPL